jgi:hypothetical protein
MLTQWSFAGTFTPIFWFNVITFGAFGVIMMNIGFY